MHIVLVALCLASCALGQGLVVPVADHFVEFATEGQYSFRVSIAYGGGQPSQVLTPMIDSHATSAPYTTIGTGNTRGIKTAFGSIQIDMTTGAFQLMGSSGNTITSTPQLSMGTGFGPPPNKTDTCVLVTPNTDVAGGQRTPGCPNGLADQTQATCCAACNKDKNCTMWVFAPGGPDNTGHNCWLMMNVPSIVSRSGRVTGGTTVGGSPTVRISLGSSANALFYGAGAGGGNTNALTVTSSQPQVDNTQFFTPHYWSTDGYAALGVSPQNFTANNPSQYPAAWTSGGGTVVWTIAGMQVDIYLMPAPSAYAGMQAYWDLTGPPRIPPRYVFGFLACRWGWVNASYIQSMLTQFRSGNYPLDAWISDFGWYTPVPDYNLPNSGSPTFHDFSYNNITFTEPVPQLDYYHNVLHLRFGGIRKPRLGNSFLLDMARDNGWLLDGSRNLNYSIQATRDWYSSMQLHYLKDGVSFWWNDEGETQYFNFYWWNLAHVGTLNMFNASTRYFSINRSYSPGMQRLGVAIWTGDVGVSWQALAQQPGYLLNWIMAGGGYITCDIGGFNGPDDTPDLLVRWYQVGVFLSVMRVHSTLSDLPHFPFLYGPVAGAAMRKALNLRYSLVPMLYSLAHGAFTNGMPVQRALMMEFPTDPAVAQLTTQWLTGSHLMVAPVLNEDADVSVYLPAALWYEFNSTSTYEGPQTLSVTGVPLDGIPIFVRAGGIIPLAPIIQYTDQLPGGPLQLQIYGGANGLFTLVEDDGETRAYEGGAAFVRSTTFTWTDATSTLSWAVQGVAQDSHAFVSFQAVGFFQNGSTKMSGMLKIAGGGSIMLS